MRVQRGAGGIQGTRKQIWIQITQCCEVMEIHSVHQNQCHVAEE